MSTYQPRTPERLIEILLSEGDFARSWRREAADQIQMCADARADALRLHREKVDCFEKLIAAEADALGLRNFNEGLSKIQQQLEVRIEKLEAALRPFAKMADSFNETAHDDSWTIHERRAAGGQRLTLGHLRAARNVVTNG